MLRRPDEALGRHAHREVLTLVVFAIMTLPQEVWMCYLILHHRPEHSGLLVAFRVEFLIQRGLRTFSSPACTRPTLSLINGVLHVGVLAETVSLYMFLTSRDLSAPAMRGRIDVVPVFFAAVVNLLLLWGKEHVAHCQCQ